MIADRNKSLGASVCLGIPCIRNIKEAIIPRVINPFATNVKIRVTSNRARGYDTTIGINSRLTIPSNPQLGPSDSGSGIARYTPEAASIATNPGQRGSRTVFLFIDFSLQHGFQHVCWGLVPGVVTRNLPPETTFYPAPSPRWSQT